MGKALRSIGRRISNLVWIAVLLFGMIPIRAAAYTCPCTIWSPSQTPATANTNDGKAVELGVKFRSSIAGSITGVRFYKGSQNTGTHTGSLWTTGGTKLATATFTNETASGWQQVNFANPVAVAANTTYVASYHAPVGRYSSNGNYFVANTTGDTPVQALASNGNGGNGVYKYGASGFPSSTYNRTNYWVDVVFSNTVVADTTPPSVANTAPTGSQTNVPVGNDITATFSEGLNATTINTSTFELRDPTNTIVSAAVSYNSANNIATLNPSSDLDTSTQYTATLKGGGTDPRIKDAAGNALAANYAWSFTTSSGASLDQGPGGPVLVIKDDSNPHSKYLSEILRAEGFNSFTSATQSAITTSGLAAYDVVIIGEVPITATQANTLNTWVNGGGNLIAMRPDSDLNSLLGVTPQTGSLDNAYMRVDTSAAPGAGIVSETMQYHGAANKYTASSGTTAVATLYSDAGTATSNPAVTMRSVGGGQAAAFSYDLAKSVIQTRQGNPAWAGTERDGSDPIRPNDLFYGAKTGDIQPDWINLDKAAIPQADEQQRLLGNMIGYMNQNKKPLPKFWYLPKGAKAAVVMVGDDHATQNGTVDTFNSLSAKSPAGCDVANWECYRATSLVYTGSPMTNSQAVAYESQGFDVGVHVSTGCNNWTPASLSASFAADIDDFKQKYSGVNAQGTSRTHCIAWSDWSTQPVVEFNNGIRLDLNYYYWPGGWVQNRSGFMTGSGLPMRFADSSGAMIDVFQQPTHLVNEAYSSDAARMAAVTSVLDRAVGSEGYYGAFGTHYDHSDSFDTQLRTAAAARGVPLVSGQQILDWTDGRNNSSLTNMTWDNTAGELDFTANADVRTNGMLRGMLPVSFNGKTLGNISRGGTNVGFTTENIKGVSYALFPVQSGNFTATYTGDTGAPTVTTTNPTSAATNISTLANITATFSENMDISTVSGSTFELRDSSNNLVSSSVSYNATTKVATLDPNAALANSATYTATIKGGATGAKDLAGNPMAANKVWSFTTAQGFVCPCSIFNSGTPADANVNDAQAVELGVKFQSDVAGYITGIRFYKGPSGNTGTHVGNLWTNGGTKLATATFTNETTSGWQQVNFATPVAISPNTTYVASYHAPNGFYAATNGGLFTQVTSAPLRALASNASGGNGVYKYGASGFPTSSYEESNYWVDVVFTQ